MPQVSVLLLTYKSNPEYLKQSLESALNQSFEDIELLVVDDGPGDANASFLEEYQKKDKRLRVIRNSQRIGRLKSRNKGIEEARGKYIAVLDSDDFWCDENKLKKQVDCLDRNPRCGAVGTGMVLIDEKGKEIGRIRYPGSDQEIRNHMLSSFQMAHPSIVFCKKAAEKVGGYSESKLLKFAEDYDFFLRVGQHCQLANIPDYCLKYRVHPGSGSTRNEFKQRLTGILLTLKYFGKYPKGTGAIIKKIATMFLPRSLMDKLISRNRLAGKIYSKTTGIHKQIK